VSVEKEGRAVDRDSEVKSEIKLEGDGSIGWDTSILSALSEATAIAKTKKARASEREI
jgi:hypothetical protein